MDRVKRFSKKEIAIWCYGLLFIGVNFLRIFDNVFQGDELFSVTLVKNSIGQIIKTTASDVHPPLHYLILHLFWLIFGDKGWVYHLAVYLPYAFTIILCLTIVKKRFGYVCSVITITLASLTGNAVRFNMEVRMYSLMALFCFLSYLFLYEILLDEERKQRKNYFWFAFFSLCAAYTHYYALITVAFFYLALLVWTCCKYRKITKELIVTYLGTIIGYLPWFGILLKTFMEKSATGTSIKHITSFLECCWFVFTNWKLLYIFLIVVFLFFIYDFNIVTIKRTEQTMVKKVYFHLPHFRLLQENMIVIAGIVSMIGTLAVGMIISRLVKPLFYTRYAYGATTVLFLVFGICVSKMNFRKILCVILTIFIFYQCFGAFMVTWRDERDVYACYNYFIEKMDVRTNNLIYNNGYPMDSFVVQYFPEAKRISAKDMDEVVEKIEEIQEPAYLILNEEIPEKTIQEIKQAGCSIYYIYSGLLCYKVQYGYYTEWEN